MFSRCLCDQNANAILQNSIGRYSTIHEESGEDSESSYSSKQGNILKTVTNMGQFYTTVDPEKMEDNSNSVDQNSPQTAEMEADSANNRITPVVLEDAMDERDDYEIVDADELRDDDIVDYKSDQFSKSPQSSPSSTVNSSWRTSQASTTTVDSSSTAVDSEDTLAKDMSELSSINSRLSTLNDQGDPCFDSIDSKIVSIDIKTDSRFVFM